MMNFTLRSTVVAASSLLLIGISEGHAGPDAARAEAYFNAISGGNADTIASFYADDAEFHWIGGPLAGKYKGRAKIKGVWEKFSAAAGKLEHEVLQLSEAAAGKTTTVTARVLFKADSEVPVKFVMVYKDGKIASEVWQVDRSGTSEAKAQPEAGEKPAQAVAAPAADAPAQPGNQPQREAANTPAADSPAPQAAPADAPAPGAAAPAPASAPTPATATAPATDKAPKTEAKPVGEPKGKYAAEKKGGSAENDDGYAYGKRGYKPRKPYHGHGGYYGHRHGYGYDYGWHGGYGRHGHY